MLDEREGKRDKVYVLPESLIQGVDGDEDEVRVFPNWIEWLRFKWEIIEEEAKESGHTRRNWRREETPPPRDIPAKDWLRRDEPGYLQWEF
jgi:hypothetical protein